MSKSSARRRKASSQQVAQQASKTQPGGSAKATKKASTPAKSPKAAKTRGAWLTGALALMTVDAVISTVLPFVYRKNTVDITNPGLVAGAIAVGLLALAGVVLMWMWKRAGIYVFLASVAGSVAVGMFVYPSQIVAFHAIVPLLILSAALSVDKKLPLFE